MPKFLVTLLMSETYHSKAIVEIDANTEEDASIAAKEMALDGDVEFKNTDSELENLEVFMVKQA